MDRRQFLKLTVGGIALAAATPAWPFRVYSFPKSVIVRPLLHETGGSVIALQLERIRPQLPSLYFNDVPKLCLATFGPRRSAM